MVRANILRMGLSSHASMSTAMKNPSLDTPESVLRRFLCGIDSGDLTALDEAWADDGSMFFPFLNTPRLAVGKAAIVERFSALIEKFRGRDMVPPYVGFDLRDLHVEMVGEVALCTF